MHTHARTWIVHNSSNLNLFCVGLFKLNNKNEQMLIFLHFCFFYHDNPSNQDYFVLKNTTYQCGSTAGWIGKCKSKIKRQVTRQVNRFNITTIIATVITSSEKKIKLLFRWHNFEKAYSCQSSNAGVTETLWSFLKQFSDNESSGLGCVVCRCYPHSNRWFPLAHRTFYGFPNSSDSPRKQQWI